MTASPLIFSEVQFLDADGKPYAGGSLATFVPGTSTAKQTWVDQGQSAVSTNPIVLDAAGRAQIWADGDYRLVLRDSVGNQVWDILSTTIVSAAMYPVVSAPTIADAVNLLGLGGGSVSDEAAARSAADSAEQTARIAADNALGARIDNEVTARTAADDNLQTQINTITGGTAPTLVLPAGYSMRFGLTVSDGGGNWSATFSPPFPSACDSVTTACQSSSWWGSVTSRSAGGCGGKTSSPLHGGGFDGGPIGVYFIAIGH
jgi:hypothetical protein